MPPDTTPVDPAAVAAARLRINGTLRAADVDDATLQTLRQRLAAVGQQLTITSDGTIATGPAEGTGPLDSFPDLDIPTMSPVRQQAFAAVLRACWPDPATDPHPGVPADISQILRAVKADPGSRGGRTAHVTGFLRDLADSGLITLTDDGATVTLGPTVAAWNTSIIDSFRRVYARLPEPPAAP